MLNNQTTVNNLNSPANTKSIARMCGVKVGCVMERVRDLNLARAYSAENRVWYIESRDAHMLVEMIRG